MRDWSLLFKPPQNEDSFWTSIFPWTTTDLQNISDYKIVEKLLVFLVTCSRKSEEKISATKI